MSSVAALLARARAVTRPLRTASRAARDGALSAMAEALRTAAAAILQANQQDLAEAGGLSSALQDRLRLDPARLEALVRAVEEVRAQPDPLASRRPLGRGRSGIEVFRQRVPLGVVAIVYEARPNVTAECAALTVKSGNVVVLRGGKEALRTNRALAQAVRSGLARAGLPEDAALFIEDTSREAVTALLTASGQVDLAIPRGGPSLMALVDAVARVPVIRHGQGICQVYLDRRADLQMAVDIAFNAKVQRPGVCNAMETLLVHRERLEPILAALGPRLQAAQVELRADPESRAVLLRAGVAAQEASAADWDTEFLELVLAVRAVPDLEAVLEHIAEHGTHHTAAIVTEDPESAERFLNEVDASCVLWNASTRLNDGGELGLGAEMGISTSKMHAYGPMSALELTAEKLVVRGQGQIRR